MRASKIRLAVGASRHQHFFYSKSLCPCNREYLSAQVHSLRLTLPAARERFFQGNRPLSPHTFLCCLFLNISSLKANSSSKLDCCLAFFKQNNNPDRLKNSFANKVPYKNKTEKWFL